MALLLLGLTIGVVVGNWDELFQIPPVNVSQYYGVAQGTDSKGRFCINNSEEGVRCAVLRLPEGADPPEEGYPVRGGYAELPSDTSDLPEPSWLWVTLLSCGWEGTEDATRCPSGTAP